MLVFVNGIFNDDLSKITPQDGLTVKSMEHATTENNDAILNFFGKMADSDSFSSLNTALTQDGVFVEAAKNTDAELPIYIYYINTAQDVEVFSTPRNLFVANEGSSVKLIEKNITLGAHNSFTNSVTEVFVKENAAVHHIKVQNDVVNSYEVVQTRVHQESNSNYSAYTISLSGGMIRNNLNIVSDGQNCESNMYGLYLLKDKTHVDNHTSVDHRSPNSYSNELYKGVMDGHSKGVFNGKIFVRQEAQKTNAFQSNNNILLS
ncbi:MAG: SufD family Fe-S cluster assembly protein, partial [Bacteroidota bacterium]